jgi:hypothetical protein
VTFAVPYNTVLNSIIYTTSKYFSTSEEYFWDKTTLLSCLAQSWIELYSVIDTYDDNSVTVGYRDKFQNQITMHY